MSPPVKPSATSPRSVSRTARAPEPKAPVASAPVAAAAQKSPAPSEFDGKAKKKTVNFTGGGFKAVARAKSPVSQTTVAAVSRNRTAAAMSSAPAKADVKVGAALGRVLAKSPATAADLKAELSKLSPAQQQELVVALPDQLRLQLAAELKKLPPSERGPQLTWMGDRQVPGVAKDGYVSVTAAPTLNILEGRGTTKINYPASIDLGNGKLITAKAEGDSITVKYGNQTLRAEKVVGGWAFYEQVKAVKDGDVIDHGGKAWRPVSLDTASKDQRTMMTTFREGSVIASNFSGRLDPGTEQVFRDRAITAAIPGARKSLDKLEVEAKQLTGFVASSADWINFNLKWIGPGVKAGYLELGKGADGAATLSLKRPSGMRDGEWQKIQNEFGPRITKFGEKLAADQKWLATELSMRDDAAQGALSTFRGAPFQKFLASLPPRERIDEVTRLSQSLKGTSAGRALADQLFGPDALKAGPDGKLVPSSAMAKLVFEGSTTPEGRAALKDLALSLGPQLSGSGAATLARTFEVLRGETLSPGQRAAVEALHNIQSPKEFEALTNPDPKSPPSVLQKAGDLSDLLAALGSASSHEKLGGSANEVLKSVSETLEPRAAQLARGAHYVAMFQVFNSTKDLLEKGLTVDTASDFAGSAARAIGTWGEILEAAGKSGFISKAGKFAGPVSDAIGLVNDMRRETSSSEGTYQQNVHVGASALILGGGLVGGPIGVAGVLVGLGVKLFYNRTSDAYESMHGTLKREFPKEQ